MCQWGKSRLVRVKVHRSLSATGRTRWRAFPIDSCIAGIVRALQRGGIDMLGSCCGHGKRRGSILLADGRKLIVVGRQTA